MNLSLRREKTLLRWYGQFSTWQWPVDFHGKKPQEIYHWETCKRWADEIQMELGHRVLKANRFGRPNAK